MDIYFCEEETTQAIEDLVNDEVYDDLLAEGLHQTNPAPLLPQVPQPGDRFTARRAQLLASKPAAVGLPGGTAPRNVKEKSNRNLQSFFKVGILWW